MDDKRELPKNGQEFGEQINLRRAEAWAKVEKALKTWNPRVNSVEFYHQTVVGTVLQEIKANEEWLQEAGKSIEEHRLDPPRPDDKITTTMTRNEYGMVILALANYQLNAEAAGGEIDGYPLYEVFMLKEALKKLENEQYRGQWAMHEDME